jgi:arylsulfatase A-like enzyme
MTFRSPLLAAIGLIAALPVPLWAAADSKPNVLVILTDDQGNADLGCQGSKDLRTPHIDSLAASGVRCTNGYVTAPQCGPSRAGIISGINQSRFGYHDNNKNRGLPAKAEAPTIAEVLQQAGYRTGMFGKWHVGEGKMAKAEKADRGDDAEEKTPDPQTEANRPWLHGFDTVVMHHGGATHYFPYSPEGKAWMTTRGREPRLREVNGDSNRLLDDLPENTYVTDYFSARAAEFIRKNAGTPWFVYLAYNAPHEPVTPLKADLEANNHIKDRKRRSYAGAMTAVDRGVGELLATLKETGQLENTLIFYLSDNGAPPENGGSNEPLQGLKGDLYEGGVRVPYLVSWPAKLPAGEIYSKTVSSLDILPTAAAAAGQPLHETLDGVNLIPFLSSKDPAAPHPRHFVMWRQGTAGFEDSLKVIRDNQQPKALRYDHIKKLPKNAEFDLSTNLSEDPENMITGNPKVDALAKALAQWRSKVVAESETGKLESSPSRQ